MGRPKTAKAAEETFGQRLARLEEGHYGRWDVLSPRRTWMDITRKKQFDCFISYYSGDSDFVDRLERDLTLRDLFV